MAAKPAAPDQPDAQPMTLKRFRFLKGYETQTDLARACDIANPTISEMESGSDGYRAAREAMCAVLGIDMRSLYRLIDVSREVNRREESEKFGERYP